MDKVTMSVKYGAPYNETFPESTGYTCTLRYKGRRMTIPYYMGLAHTDEPTVTDVLECLFLDADSYNTIKDFVEFCQEFGYEMEQLRDAERAYKGCKAISHKLRNLLRDDYESVRDAQVNA